MVEGGSAATLSDLVRVGHTGKGGKASGGKRHGGGEGGPRLVHTRRDDGALGLDGGAPLEQARNANEREHRKHERELWKEVIN